MASFRSLINSYHKVRANPKSNIAQRINPHTPLADAESINYLAKSLKSILSFGTTGSVGSSMGASGLQLRSGPTGGGSVETGYFAIMRGYGTNLSTATDKQERFIQVQKVFPTDTNPWDHKWKIDLEETMFPVSCYPGWQAIHYSVFMTRASDFSNAIVLEHTPILDIQQRSGVSVAIPYVKFPFPQSETNPQYRISDCIPQAT